jgi:anti-sigma factor RsiW
MRHPEELLSSYVDGTLDTRERAEVDAHLRECETCRDEVRLAGRARTVRPGIERASPRWGRDRFRRTAWASGFAAAAGIAAILALVFVGNHPGNGGGASSALASNGPSAPPARAPAVVQTNREYGPSSINDLAASFARSDAVRSEGSAHTQSETASGVAAGAVQPSPSKAPLSMANNGKFAATTSQTPRQCLRRGSTGLGVSRLLQLIEARYEGSRAFIGVFLRDGVLPSAVVVAVVSPSTCRLVASAEQRLP